MAAQGPPRNALSRTYHGVQLAMGSTNKVLSKIIWQPAYSTQLAVTVKMNYLLRRIEPILNSLTRSEWKVFLKTDAANGDWAVPLAPGHAYKTGFQTVLGQDCYLRMGQGLTVAPGTY